MLVASGESRRKSGIYTAFQIQGVLETLEKLTFLWSVALMVLGAWLNAWFSQKMQKH